MSAHTPGPWEARVQDCGAGSIATVYNTVDGWVEIWSPNWMDQRWTEEVSSADARLICAAPDLLAALIDCIENMEYSTPQGQKARETAAALIAATGMTP